MTEKIRQIKESQTVKNISTIIETVKMMFALIGVVFTIAHWAEFMKLIVK